MNSKNANAFHYLQRISPIIISCMISALPLRGAEKTYTLPAILERIHNDNASLHIAADNIQALEAQAAAVRTWTAPMIGTGPFMAPLQTGTHIGSWMIEAEQAIPDFKQQKTEKKSFLAQKEVVCAQNERLRNELYAQAKTLYYTWFITLKKITIFRENDTLFRFLKTLMHLRYPYHQESLNPSYLITSFQQNNHNALITATQTIKSLRIQLNALMYAPLSDSLWQIDTSIHPHFLIALDPEAGPQKDIAIVKAMQSVLNQNLQLIQLQTRPKFSIKLGYMQPFHPQMPLMYTAMGRVTLPLAPWSSGQYKHKKRALYATSAALEKEKNNQLIQSRARLQALQAEIEGYIQKIDALQQQILPALEKNKQLYFAYYQESRAELSQVIAAWETWHKSRLELLEQQHNLYQLIIRYDKALYRP